MTFQLTNVNGWTENVLCVTTALCAISGLRPGEIAQLLSEVALNRGESVPADPALTYNINDWLKAIRCMGGEWCQIEEFSNLPFSSRKTISEYLTRGNCNDIFLVFGENEAEDMTHVFAMADGELVDTHTGGRKVYADPTRVPEDYNKFKVKRVFRVR